VDPGRARGGDCLERPRTQDEVLPDERAVEVARDGLDAAREPSREDYLPDVAWTT
jgi:hypothetical protein